MNPIPTIISNKWHPLPKNPHGSYTSYPTPSAILRESLGEKNYKFIAEGPNADYIRAACILPLNYHYSHLMAVPWSMSFRSLGWRMIIVSTLDTMTWIELARSSGSVSYWKSSSVASTYQWEMYPMDQYNAKIRPANALGATGAKPVSKKILVDI